MFNSSNRFLYDTRTFAEVVKGGSSQSVNVALSWRRMLNVVESYERQWGRCPRLSNFYKVHVLVECCRDNRMLRFWNTATWRKLFYVIRDRVSMFYNNRIKLLTISCTCRERLMPPVPRSMHPMVQCNQRRDEPQRLDALKQAWRRMRGPHCMDLFIFIHLSRRANLGNDLALYIFDFI